ncbi:hypothetical protein SCMU_27880 [Sinomonas cyclohexanicum]|uniref:Uncharacterized protein n=1 Tax=Sinomonas cyclohexanicum TaxID=322009 RepID=A0ABN6FJU1_SINCY|nr:hypothetical protein SCMU_27880 [Corynebacterium cyclohexanicum]
MSECAVDEGCDVGFEPVAGFVGRIPSSPAIDRDVRQGALAVEFHVDAEVPGRDGDPPVGFVLDGTEAGQELVKSF